MLLLAPFGYNSNLSSLGSGFALGEKGEKKNGVGEKKKNRRAKRVDRQYFSLDPIFWLEPEALRTAHRTGLQNNR